MTSCRHLHRQSIVVYVILFPWHGEVEQRLQVALYSGGYVICLRAHKDLSRRTEPEVPQFSQGSLITWLFISGGCG